MIQNEPKTETSLFQPVVEKLPVEFDLWYCFERLQHLPHLLVLESSMQHESLGRYSYMMADPVLWLEPDSISEMAAQLSKLNSQQIESLPPFQGGLSGLIAYDYNRKLESIPQNAIHDFTPPPLAFGLYDVVLAFDHNTKAAWLISQGFKKTLGRSEGWESTSSRTEHAKFRSDAFWKILHSDPLRSHIKSPPPKEISELAPQFPVPGPEGLTSDFSREHYLSAAQKCIDYIYAGDVFQINLSQRLLAPASCSSAELYHRLRNCNPATFSGFFDLGESQVISASPERFISIHDSEIETRPIKGTRRRTRFPQIDLAVAQQLLSSEKDRAENIMIVDLMRNDLSKICEDDSVEVTQLCELEKYQSVFHLVSAVKGKLRSTVSVFEALEATFPGGSITGAPKVRAMEIIAELEPTSRGAYCGSLGYIGLNGDVDFNILIRTITASGGWWQVPVGGGLVAQSDPLREYEETWTKAAGMLAAIARRNEA
ncbi:aminodeoxychorismate synthase component I [bacterium]|nr:aminodeoxychorismate synthase component I [bacterium]